MAGFWAGVYSRLARHIQRITNLLPDGACGADLGHDRTPCLIGGQLDEPDRAELTPHRMV